MKLASVRTDFRYVEVNTWKDATSENAKNITVPVSTVGMHWRRQARSHARAMAAMTISSDFPYHHMKRFAERPAATHQTKHHSLDEARPANTTSPNIRYMKPRLSWSVSILPIDDRIK